MNFELRHLRAFVALAEELNFTRAAERLHLAQQALSTQIRQLEERLDTTLVDRTPRKVELTPAGHALYERAVAVLAAAEGAAAAVRVASGERPSLKVGFVTPFDHEGVVPLLELYAERRPDVDVGIHFAPVLETTGGLREGAVDVGITAGRFDGSGLESELLWTEPLGVALAADHPLASSDEISVEEYLEMPIFDYPTPDRVSHDYWMGIRYRGGRPPHFVAQFHGLDALLQGVRAGLGVSLIRERVVDSLGPDSGVVFRPLADDDPAEMALVWRSGDERDVVTDFAAAAREAFAPDSARL